MARPRLGEGDTLRLHIKISPEELTAIDDWRFANRVESRSEAIRRLCKIALILDEELETVVDTGISLDQLTFASFQRASDLSILSDLEEDAGEDLSSIQALLKDNVEWSSDVSDLSRYLRVMLIGMWNAVAAMSDKPDMKSASEASAEAIARAGELLNEMNDRQRQYAENRLLQAVLADMTSEENETYKALSADDQSAFLEAKVEARRAAMDSTETKENDV